MDNTPTTNTISEQSQNPSQAGSASTSISKDVGDAPTGSDLKDRMDEIEKSTSIGGGAMKVGEEGQGVGDGGEHGKAAERQP